MIPREFATRIQEIEEVIWSLPDKVLLQSGVAAALLEKSLLSDSQKQDLNNLMMKGVDPASGRFSPMNLSEEERVHISELLQIVTRADMT